MRLSSLLAVLLLSTPAFAQTRVPGEQPRVSPTAIPDVPRDYVKPQVCQWVCMQRDANGTHCVREEYRCN